MPDVSKTLRGSALVLVERLHTVPDEVTHFLSVKRIVMGNMKLELRNTVVNHCVHSMEIEIKSAGAVVCLSIKSCCLTT